MENQTINYSKNVSLSPFLHSGNSIQKIMLSVILALMPATIASIYFFRAEAVKVLVPAILGAVVFEIIANLIMKRSQTVGDLSAVLSGLLLGLCLPPGLPIWITLIGSFVAIIIVKQLFGGLGQNIFNPAAAARGFLLVSFAAPMTKYLNPIDLGVSEATPLYTIRKIMFQIAEGDKAGAVTAFKDLKGNNLSIYKDLLLGNTSGSLGETAALFLLIGGIFLIAKKIINWEIPTLYIGTFTILCLIYGQVTNLGPTFALLEVLSGGLFLGAFFMATDYVTNPMTFKGRVIFAISLGVITFLIRVYGNFPEGVLFAIIIMNLVTPTIDRYTKGRIFGTSKKKKKEAKNGK